MKGQPPSPEAAAPRRNLAVLPPSWRPRTGGTARPSTHLAAWSPPPRSPQGRHRRRTTLLSKKWVFSQASYRTSRHVQIWSFATGVKRRKPQGVALPLLSFSVGQTGTFLCSASLSVTLRETEICKRTESQYRLSLHTGSACTRAGGGQSPQKSTQDAWPEQATWQEAHPLPMIPQGSSPSTSRQGVVGCMVAPRTSGPNAQNLQM